MGILDDAIREHLELKRRHGVAEEELQRQEDEALGPARRDVAQQREETELAPGLPATAEAPPTAEASAAEPTPVEPPPVEPPPAEAGASEEAPVEHEAPVAEEAPVGEPGHDPDPRHALGDTEPHGFEAVEDEDEDEEAEPYDRDPDDEDLPAADAEDAEDAELDVLEDTPDFLQETPEHDRLWFEQKPPRDFDFD